MTNITVNEKARSIELTKKDYAKACKYGTQEYIDIQEVRKAYPTFKVVEVTRKVTKSDKPTFKGLTYEYMEKYIKSHDNAEENMAEYMELRGISEEGEEALAESFNYQEMKDWFLDKYPEIANFHEKRAELIEKAQQKKATKREEEARAKREAHRKALLAKKTA